MHTSKLKIHNLIDLRDFVYTTLCEQNDFEVGAFELSERYLVRSGRPCGIFFCVHGPRSVRVTAIWEVEGNTILFYGATGERLLKTRLTQQVGIAHLAKSA